MALISYNGTPSRLEILGDEWRIRSLSVYGGGLASTGNGHVMVFRGPSTNPLAIVMLGNDGSTPGVIVEGNGGGYWWTDAGNAGTGGQLGLRRVAPVLGVPQGVVEVVTQTGASRDLQCRDVILTGGRLARSSAAFTNGAGGNAGTLTNAPRAGNPTKWIPVDDNGTTLYIAAW